MRDTRRDVAERVSRSLLWAAALAAGAGFYALGGWPMVLGGVGAALFDVAWDVWQAAKGRRA